MVIALFSQEINESVSNVIESFFSSKHAKHSKFFLENKIFNSFKSDNNLELISFSKSEDLDSSIDILVNIGGSGSCSVFQISLNALTISGWLRMNQDASLYPPPRVVKNPIP